MRKQFPALLFAAAFTAAACAPADDDLADMDADVDVPPATTTAPPASPAPASLTLTPLNESGVMGTIDVSVDGRGVQLEGQASGVNVGESLMGHVHRGTCASLEQGMQTVAEFGPVEIMEDGHMSGSVDAGELGAGDYAISFHRNDGSPHVACADYQVHDDGMM